MLIATAGLALPSLDLSVDEQLLMPALPNTEDRQPVALERCPLEGV